VIVRVKREVSKEKEKRSPSDAEDPKNILKEHLSTNDSTSEQENLTPAFSPGRLLGKRNPLRIKGNSPTLIFSDHWLSMT